jgi:hypothetical protein
VGIRKLSEQRPSAGGGTGSVAALNDVGDVNAAAPDDGDVLAWDATPGEWIPVAPGTPGAHASSHQDGGGDEMSVAGLAGVLADAQKVAIHKNGTLVGTRKNVNLIEGTNVTLTVADDGTDDEVDVTIAASGSGSGTTVTLASRVFPAYDDDDIGIWGVAPHIYSKRRRWETTAALSGGASMTGGSNVATTPNEIYYAAGLTPHVAIATATSADSGADCRNTMPEWDMGDMAGGWFYAVRFCAVTSPAFKSDSRVFIGMHTITSAIPGTTDPSSLLNICGLGKDDTDTSFQFMHNDGSGTATKVATSLGSPTAETFYDFFMYCPPGGGSIGWLLQDAETQTSLGSGTVTTNLPESCDTINGLYTPHFYMGNGSGSTATRLDMLFLQIEAPF